MSGERQGRGLWEKGRQKKETDRQPVLQMDKMNHTQGRTTPKAEPHPRLSSPGRDRWARISVRTVAGTSPVVREEPGRQGQVEGGGLVAEAASACYQQTDG